MPKKVFTLIFRCPFQYLSYGRDHPVVSLNSHLTHNLKILPSLITGGAYKKVQGGHTQRWYYHFTILLFLSSTYTFLLVGTYRYRQSLFATRRGTLHRHIQMFNNLNATRPLTRQLESSYNFLMMSAFGQLFLKLISGRTTLVV